MEGSSSKLTGPVDTRGLLPEMQGKNLTVYFRDGEVCQIKLLSLDIHVDCSLCDGYTGFIYDLLSTSTPGKYARAPKNGAYWGNFEDVERVETLA
jgi:hypothetical protein